jgi:hypothetical protein
VNEILAQKGGAVVPGALALVWTHITKGVASGDEANGIDLMKVLPGKILSVMMTPTTIVLEPEVIAIGVKALLIRMTAETTVVVLTGEVSAVRKSITVIIGLQVQALRRKGGLHASATGEIIAEKIKTATKIETRILWKQ